MINENYFAANGCSLLFFDRQARRLSDERYGKYHADETSALPGGLSVILSNSGFFVPFYVESRLHPYQSYFQSGKKLQVTAIQTASVISLYIRELLREVFAEILSVTTPALFE